MDFKSLNLKIPRSRFFYDKLGLNFPKFLLHDEKFLEYSKGPVTFLQWGNTARILFHDELLQLYPTPLEGILETMRMLMLAGVFQPEVALWFSWLWGLYVLDLATPDWLAAILCSRFDFTEMELTLDLPGIEFLVDRDPDLLTQKFIWTFYSKLDHNRVYRERLGEIELKSFQKSFFSAYRKDLQLGLDYPVYRLEFRLSGKYSRYLSPHLLTLSPFEALTELAPSIKKIIKKIQLDKALNLNPIAYFTSGSLLSQIMAILAWYPQKQTPAQKSWGDY